MKCTWPGKDALMMRYHDEEWGKPLYNDKKPFEFLILETFQAGLSWRTILYKRKNFRKAFSGFDAKKVAKYDKKKVNALLKDAGIIRNRLKIEAAVNNAKCFLQIRQEYGSFAKYIWGFVNHQPIMNNPKTQNDIPSRTKISDTMSEDLRKRGFKFRGSTICYAFMQAVGMVNDHLAECECKNR